MSARIFTLPFRSRESGTWSSTTIWSNLSAERHPGGDYDASEQFHRPAMRACINQATSKAVAAVNSPLLTKLHNGETGATEKVADVAPQR